MLNTGIIMAARGLHTLNETATVVSKLLEGLGGLRSDAIDFAVGVLNIFVVPLAGLAVICYMLFQIITAAISHNKGEDISEKWSKIFVSGVTLVIILCYGVFVGDWVQFLV